jgi:hypothetical protein
MFLEYINDARHIWIVCIGVPYGMNVWQVGAVLNRMVPSKILGRREKSLFTGKVTASSGVQD